MIRVCHLTSAHKATDVRIFYKECVSLANEGFEVYLVATGESYVQNGVNIIGIGKTPVSRLGRMTKTARIVYKTALGLNCDIYHLHDPELLPFAVLLKKKGKIVIFDSHEDYYQQIQNKKYIPKIFRIPISNIYKLYQNQICRYLDGFIFPACPSSIKVPIKVTRVDNSPIYNRSQSNNSFETKRKSICYIGSITEDRGLTCLVKAAFLANIPLILAGPFQSEIYKDFLMNLPEFIIVEYRGVLNPMEIEAILKESTIGISVSLNVGQYGNTQNLATKVVEYCKYGLPVVLNKTPYNKYMIDKYNFGIYIENPKDIKQYSQAILELINSPEKIKLYGTNGMKLVDTHLNWNKEFKNLKNLYLELLTFLN